ncbi:MAG: hypothetical protein JWO31_12 [Phycisphaerales bacterium]|nr:hypothetical protein [Phycisphaerales bacterium]
MGRLGTAFRAFFRVLGDAAVADQVDRLLSGAPPATTPPVVATPPAVATPHAASVPFPAAQVPPAPKLAPALVPPAAPAAVRSDALTLLAVLQREARLVDFLKEPIAGYADAQVGAAVREIHRDAAAALDRMFALAPVRVEPEGSVVTLAAGYDAGRVRLVGNVTGAPPHAGTLAHPGWEATKVELPAWSGSAGSANVVAPAEVELR